MKKNRRGRQVRRLIVSLLLFFISFNINPIDSFALSKTFFEFNMYFEFVDLNGEDFPIPLQLEYSMMYTKRTGMSLTPEVTIVPMNPLNSEPSTNGRFRLYFGTRNVSAYPTEGNASASAYEVLRDISVYPINPEDKVSYIKGFSLDPPPGKTKLDRLTREYLSSNVVSTRIDTMTDRDFIKNTDKFEMPNNYRFGSLYAVRIGSRSVTHNTPSINSSWSQLGKNGEVLRFYAQYYQIVEIYEDQDGNSIPAPPGYVDGKGTAITSDPFHYQMENDRSLPRSYTDATHAYVFDGWYKGAGNQASIDHTYPPTIGFEASMDDLNEVHIVYKKIPLDQVVQLKEKFIDESGAQIEAAWDQTSSVEKDVPITVTPATPKTDTSGADWEYLGWKWDTDPTGTVNQTPINLPMAADTEIHYIYKKIQHTTTEKWVDVDDGTTLIDLTPNPKTSQINSNETFTSNPAATITDREGNEWEYIGWENVSDDPGNVQNQSTVSIPNLKVDKEIKYHYKRLATTAALELSSDKQIVDNGDNVSWTARLTNTGTTALKNIVLKATGNYSNGLSTPGQLTVTPAGKGSQTFPVGATWKTTGIDLSGITIPSGGTNNYADIKFTTTATGNANQVLMAELDAAGNLTNSIQANDVVRIDDADQPNLKPTGDVGFINLPDFRFGYTRLEPHNHYKGLEKSLYERNYNPYVRLMNNTTPDQWEVFVQLDQFKSNIHTLPKTTSLTLINGALKQVQNYNHPSETLTSAGSIADQTIYSDSSSVRLMGALTQGVYQADYDFDDVQLNLIGKSGLRNRYYTSTMHWKLVTGP